MLCTKIKQIVLTKTTLQQNVQFRCLITSRYKSKTWVWIDGWLTSVANRDNSGMSPLRIILKDLRALSAWTRSSLVNNVVRRCRKDRSVREVIQCFKHAFFRPRRTLLISATAAYKAREGDDDNAPSGPPPPCDKSITDAELEELLKDLDAVEMLSRSTLFCAKCGKRLVIEKKQPGVRYCSCKTSEVSETTKQSDGWVPYMEAEDVIIWRKEYKPGLGLYAYKVYGRYPDVKAADFAAVQVDGRYRKVWDAAVAALSVVEHNANGLGDQAVLHWEVLWPRLFANRDYVYIRRHKEFDVSSRSLPHQKGLFQPEPAEDTRPQPKITERPSVHSNAKRKSIEAYAKLEREQATSQNKVYVIISRSCEHPKVPESKHAIRVSEYWSHMVVKTMNGRDKAGMEFVLTYYDEPAVGGMPSSVAAWATGRAAPAYLQRMRRAAAEYKAWRKETRQDDTDYSPFKTDHKQETSEEEETSKDIVVLREQDMESSQSGPELELSDAMTRDQGTQTEDEIKHSTVKHEPTQDKAVDTDEHVTNDPGSEGDVTKVLEEEEQPKNG
ncbi:uncharacterized protein LOC142985096 [Anticarsia gemmatalis]|uniref:uncharacterized protein LOC142985096 n=1 Tax=Anticarsia gemmatalis TaxID=129554 RepID=UPI003F7778DF